MITTRARIRELAFLNKGIALTLTDERTGASDYFKYEGGIIEYVKFLNEKKEALHEDPIYVEGSRDNIQVEVSLQYNDSYTENIYSLQIISTRTKAERMNPALRVRSLGLSMTMPAKRD